MFLGPSSKLNAGGGEGLGSLGTAQAAEDGDQGVC